ncbi:hypothetical protein THAOC_25888 [Thalassiosira oceanica]|uniref:Uncharacterized protein n=1 Tax=Thalassiosira oceanica TaxID=159749 RepID=K0S079_THAOC|nr:hypothetical protein THAOC_25888 [Thalassiosira oceanica]|eukprot:EJK54481.1 hypothetical protein THAOC_25888 [Thalassiosira oceanica]
MNGDGGRSSTPSGGTSGSTSNAAPPTSHAAPPPPVAQPGASNAPGTRENYLCSGHKIHQPTPNSSSKRRRLERPADESLSESPVEVAKPNADGSGVDPPSQVAESSDLVEDDATPLLELPALTVTPTKTTVPSEIERLYESGISLGSKKALADSDGVEMPRCALFDSNSKYFGGTNPGINSRDGRRYRSGMTLVAVVMSPEEWKQLLSSDLGNETLRNIARDVGDKAMNKTLSIENEYVNEEVVQKKPRARRTERTWRSMDHRHEGGREEAAQKVGRRDEAVAV